MYNDLNGILTPKLARRHASRVTEFSFSFKSFLTMGSIDFAQKLFRNILDAGEIAAR
jgi:hypothetical protein